MQFLVQLRLSGSRRPLNAHEGIAFIKGLVFPTLHQCEKLQEQGKILAGGPMSGAVALALIVSAESAQELDDLITTLPVWSQMETEVIPLTTFDGRRRSLVSKLAELEAQAREPAMSNSGGGR